MKKYSFQRTNISCLYLTNMICCLFLFLGNIHAQVNLQTGSAVFNIPMFNWQDGKSSLNSLLALNYSSGNGLKVSDVASNEGQGWNLIAGGSITRMQVGEPDDQMPYTGVTGSDQDITRYPAGILYASSKAFKGCPRALTKYPIYGAKNIIYSQHNSTAEDREMDYFAFQFNGKNGLFVVDLTNGGTGWSLGSSKMKISFQTDQTMATNNSSGIRTTIKSFTIQDVDGLIYKFGVNSSERGLTKVLQNQFCDPNATTPQQQPKFGNGGVYHQAGFQNSSYINPWIINSWELSEIDDPLTGRKIQFTYNTLNLVNNAGFDITDNQSDGKDYIIITHKNSVTVTPEISGITYPDGHSVTFNYALTTRVDFPGEKALASIDIKYLDNTTLPGRTRFLSEYQLGTTYFIKSRYGIPTSNYEMSVARLCLQSVKKIGPDLKEDSPPYLFDYYTGSSNTDDFVPPSFFYAKDIYGYYNGNNNVPDDNNGTIPLDVSVNDLSFHALKGLCFLNANTGAGSTMISPNPKSGYAQNGLLRQIIYPTGGTLTYQYAQNIKGTSTLYGGVHVSQTSTTDGGYSNDCAHPIVTQYNYVYSTGGSSLWGMEDPVNEFSMTSHYAPEDRKLHFSWSCGLCCYWKFQYPGIMSQYQAIDLRSWQKFLNAIAPILTVVGVFEDVMDVVNLFCGSTGVLSIVAVVVDVVGIVLGILLTCTGDGGAKNITSNVFYNTDLNAVAPMPIQFKRVEIIPGTGDIGKTVQSFTSSTDYPIWYTTNSVFSAKQRFAPWAYGLPLVTTVFDVNGNIVKKIQNVYDTSYARILLGSCNNDPNNNTPIPSSLISCKCEVLGTTSQRNTDWSKISSMTGDGGYNDPNSYTNVSVTTPYPMNVDIYGMYTGRMLLDTTYEFDYSTVNTSAYSQTTTAYTYNNSSNYEVNQITTFQSNGDINYENIKYSSDYTGGAFDVMNQNNMISVPVETTASVIKSGSSIGRQYLSEKVTEFNQLPNGDIKPSKIREQRFAQPVTNLISYQGYNSSANPAYHDIQVFTHDNITGKLTGVQDEGGALN